MQQHRRQTHILAIPSCISEDVLMLCAFLDETQVLHVVHLSCILHRKARNSLFRTGCIFHKYKDTQNKRACYCGATTHLRRAKTMKVGVRANPCQIQCLRILSSPHTPHPTYHQRTSTQYLSTLRQQQLQHLRRFALLQAASFDLGQHDHDHTSRDKDCNKDIKDVKDIKDFTKTNMRTPPHLCVFT